RTRRSSRCGSAARSARSPRTATTPRASPARGASCRAARPWGARDARRDRAAPAGNRPRAARARGPDVARRRPARRPRARLGAPARARRRDRERVRDLPHARGRTGHRDARRARGARRAEARRRARGEPVSDGLAQALVAALERAALSQKGVRFLDAAEDDGLRLTWAAILDRARGVAGALQRVGLSPGDRVALVLPTGAAFFDAFFGAALAGLVPVPLYPPVRLGRLDEYHERTAAMLRACGAKLLLCDRPVARLLGRAVARADLALGCARVEPLAPAAPDPVAIAPDDLAFLQYSSGTTAAPKPIRLTHRQVLTNARAIRAAILAAHPEGPGLTHVGVSWLPLYHDMGLVGA